MGNRRSTRRQRHLPRRLLRIEHCERRDLLAGDAAPELINLFDSDLVSITDGGTIYLSTDAYLPPYGNGFDAYTNAIDADQIPVALPPPQIIADDSGILGGWQSPSENGGLRSSQEETDADTFGAGSNQVGELRQFVPDQAVVRHAQSDPQDRAPSLRVIDLAQLFDTYDGVDGPMQGQLNVGNESPSPGHIATDAETALPTRVAFTELEHSTLEQSWAFDLATVAEHESQRPPRVAPVETGQLPEHKQTSPDVSDADLSADIHPDPSGEVLAAAQEAQTPPIAHVAAQQPAEAEPVSALDAAFAQFELVDSPATSWWSVALERRQTWAALAVGVLVALKTWGGSSEDSETACHPRRKQCLRRGSAFCER